MPNLMLNIIMQIATPAESIGLEESAETRIKIKGQQITRLTYESKVGEAYIASVP